MDARRFHLLLSSVVRAHAITSTHASVGGGRGALHEPTGLYPNPYPQPQQGCTLTPTLNLNRADLYAHRCPCRRWRAPVERTRTSGLSETPRGCGAKGIGIGQGRAGCYTCSVFPASRYFFALSQAPPVLDALIAICTPDTSEPASTPACRETIPRV